MIALGRQTLAYNLPLFMRSRDVQVVALCDVDRWRLALSHQKSVAMYRGDKADFDRLKDCPRTTDFREVLAREDIDAVMIGSPDHWHTAMVVAAARAGKDICCEKPVSRSIAEGRILADTVAEHGVVFRTDSEFRSESEFHRCCELVLNGRIGRLQTIRMAVPVLGEALPQQPEMPVPDDLDYEMWLGPAPMRPYTEKRTHEHRGYDRPGWYNCRDYSQGGLVNWGHHMADIAQWANGTERSGPVEVEGTGDFPPADGLWNVVLGWDVRYRYANGVELHYTHGEPFIRFQGTEGWIDLQYHHRVLSAEPASILDSTLGRGDKRFLLKNEKRDFLDCVKTRGQTLEDAEVGHRATSLCQLGLIACETGEKLKWDPARERFTNSDRANRLLACPPAREPWSNWLSASRK
jgi:predicted dehydrogenase